MGIPQWEKVLDSLQHFFISLEFQKFSILSNELQPHTSIWDQSVPDCLVGARLRRPLCPCDMFSKILHCVDLPLPSRLALHPLSKSLHHKPNIRREQSLITKQPLQLQCLSLRMCSNLFPSDMNLETKEIPEKMSATQFAAYINWDSGWPEEQLLSVTPRSF